MPASPSLPSGIALLFFLLLLSSLSLLYVCCEAIGAFTRSKFLYGELRVSPQFPFLATGVGTRGNRWKRRKRDPQPQGTNRRPKDDDDEEEDEEEELVDREDDAAGEDPHPNTPDPNPRETEVLSEGGVRICNFPPVVRRTVNRPHSSVLAIVVAERAGLSGESRTPTGIVLENVSYGQLQALSAVPADSPALVDGDGPTSFVAQPPQLMEGRGVVKQYGSRVHVVPMHSGSLSPLSLLVRVYSRLCSCRNLW